MSKRMLDTSIWANEHFADLPPMGRLLLIGMITMADDQGRCKAYPAYLRSQVFPYDDVSIDAINDWLDQMVSGGIITRYTENDKPLLQIFDSSWFGRVTPPSDYGSNWPSVRRKIVERDGGRCQKCGASEPLEVHHVIPLRLGGTNEPRNLTTLCVTCHRATHKWMNEQGIGEEGASWHADALSVNP